MVRTSGEESSPDLKANTRPAGMSPKEEVVYDFVTDLTTKQATFDAAFDLAKKLLDGQQAVDRDRGTPRDATPPTPPGIRVRTTAVRPS